MIHKNFWWTLCCCMVSLGHNELTKATDMLTWNDMMFQPQLSSIDLGHAFIVVWPRSVLSTSSWHVTSPNVTSFHTSFQGELISHYLYILILGTRNNIFWKIISLVSVVLESHHPKQRLVKKTLLPFYFKETVIELNEFKHKNKT